MAFERIRIGDAYYLLAPALAGRSPQLLLAHGDSVAIFDLPGDVPLAGNEAYGLFHGGTRYLSGFELRVNGALPILLSSHATEDGSELVTHLTNTDERRDDVVVLERDTIAIRRGKTLHGNALYECLDLRNYGQAPLTLTLSLLFGSDFADLFEVRGIHRPRRGAVEAPVIAADSVQLPYRGLDGVGRQTVITFSPPGWRLTPTGAELALQLGADAEATAAIWVCCDTGGECPAAAAGYAGSVDQWLEAAGDLGARGAARVAPLF